VKRALVVLVLALGVPAVAHAAPPAPVAWCGTDEVPQNRVPDLELSSTRQVRLVYAVPSDAPDNFLATASGIATDAAWIDAWWQGQDPTRTPRFDRYAFPGCTSKFGQLDIGFVRLPNPAVYYALPQTPSLRLDRDFQQLSLFTDNEKTIVYFDSPIRDRQVCGETDYLSNTVGGSPRGIVYMYLQSNCDVGAAGAGGGTLLALSGDARLPCTTGCSGLALDNGASISVTAVPAAGYVFSSWAGACTGAARTCVVAVGADTQATATFTKAALRVTVAVTGKGRVTSAPAGIACAGTCTKVFAATAVKLTAKPLAGWKFAGWAGACAGKRACTVKKPGTARARFIR
jgi:hypothetical protein